MLHPKRQPARTHHVKTADGLHTLHVQEYGDAERASCSVCYFHGGPGGGTPPDTARLFDPETIHLIVFDQRGCGRSVCDDRLRANTTEILIEDIEMVRSALCIERWGIMGSSYGSLLVALYAARHASRVSWALLHGVFLGSRVLATSCRIYAENATGAWCHLAKATPPILGSSLSDFLASGKYPSV